MHFHNGKVCVKIFQIIINDTTLNMHVQLYNMQNTSGLVYLLLAIHMYIPTGEQRAGCTVCSCTFSSSKGQDISEKCIIEINILLFRQTNTTLKKLCKIDRVTQIPRSEDESICDDEYSFPVSIPPSTPSKALLVNVPIIYLMTCKSYFIKNNTSTVDTCI